MTSCPDLRSCLPAFRCFDGPDHEPGSRRDPWNMELRGRHGWVRPYGQGQLMAYADGPIIRKKLEALGTITQKGDSETIVRFPVSEAAPILALLQVYRHPVLSEEHKEKLIARARGLAEARKAQREGPL